MLTAFVIQVAFVILPKAQVAPQAKQSNIIEDGARIVLAPRTAQRVAEPQDEAMRPALNSLPGRCRCTGVALEPWWSHSGVSNLCDHGGVTQVNYECGPTYLQMTMG